MAKFSIAARSRAREPHLTGAFAGGVYLPAPGFVPDPGGLAKAYAALFTRKGGRFLVGDARTLEQTAGGWRVSGPHGALVARDVVVALGPWSDLVFRPLGYSIPLSVKRGYHLHLAPRGNAVLNHPVLDSDLGYLLAPMNRGIRLTTGVEFARRDAPPTPIQLERALPRAHALFPLGEAVDAKPWMGARPCLPDMLPVIGRAPRHAGLWFDFGHQHHGLTLGPATGRLLAEMMTGETPFADPEALCRRALWLTISGDWRPQAAAASLRSLASRRLSRRYCDATVKMQSGADMKVNVEIDCTPLEARQFFGLPDVQPMQTAVMDKLQQQMMANIEKVSPEALMQSWFTFDPKIAERFQDMFVTMAGLGGVRASDKKK